MEHQRKIAVSSGKLLKNKTVSTLLDAGFLRLTWEKFYPRAYCAAGWGYRLPGQKARLYAKNKNLPFLCLEDGFLRSVDVPTASGESPLSIVVDSVGIYYDGTQPSQLERLITDLIWTGEAEDMARRALTCIKDAGLSKYNADPDYNGDDFIGVQPSEAVLLIDQLAGDFSLQFGLMEQKQWRGLADHALASGKKVYLKTHPDVLARKAEGCLAFLYDHPDVTVIRAPASLSSLLQKVSEVYVGTSQAGFEAAFYGKIVHVFGVPWYAGWGVTRDYHSYCDDADFKARRFARRTVPQLFYAAYILYSRYINPYTGQKGAIFDVISYLTDRVRHQRKLQGTLFCFGFRRWKRKDVLPFLKTTRNKVVFASSIEDAFRQGLGTQAGQKIVGWNHKFYKDLLALSSELNCPYLIVEDGFVRSFGFGSAFIPPLSLAFDSGGIYYDATSDRVSELETILQNTEFADHVIKQADHVIALLNHHHITKYNVDKVNPLHLPLTDKKIILVVGQVDDDSSIHYGAIGDVKNNFDLLTTVRRNYPEAFIVYKPHPEVVNGYRKKPLNYEKFHLYYDYLEAEKSVLSCIAVADEVHTLTSLSGFDALARNKKVVTYGMPFYAGWGLTDDKCALPRRTKKLTLQGLVAGALLLYPFYYDRKLKTFSDCEHVIQTIVKSRLDRNNATFRNKLYAFKPFAIVCKRLYQAKKWIFK